MIDLRSDTVTRPTRGMLEAMFRAEVGDDVLGDDPTVRRLEEATSEFLGQEAALFTPSGTMANQLALKTWTQPGDEVIADRWSHTYIHEVAAGAALSGLSFWPLETADGVLEAEAVEGAIRPTDIHQPVTRIVAVENTHNLAGGTCYTVAQLAALRELTRRRGLVLHMDGARLCNAAVATGVKSSDYGRLCDSVTLCLSKGLGCPVGSMLAGSRDFIERARRYRKMFGGGMRQAGYLAAAGLYALEHHVARLADDHANARRLAEGIAGIPGLDVDMARVQTNMVYFTFADGAGMAEQVMKAAAADGLLALRPRGRRVRLVTHLDVGAKEVDAAVDVLSRHVKQARGA